MERYREMKRIKKINDAKKSLGLTNAKKPLYNPLIKCYLDHELNITALQFFRGNFLKLTKFYEFKTPATIL